MAGARSHEFGRDPTWDGKDHVPPVEKLIVILGITALLWAMVAMIAWAIWGLVSRW